MYRRDNFSHFCFSIKFHPILVYYCSSYIIICERVIFYEQCHIAEIYCLNIYRIWNKTNFRWTVLQHSHLQQYISRLQMSKVYGPICISKPVVAGSISKKKIAGLTSSLRPWPLIDHRLKLPFIIRLIVCENLVSKIYWLYFCLRPYIAKWIQ